MWSSRGPLPSHHGYSDSDKRITFSGFRVALTRDNRLTAHHAFIHRALGRACTGMGSLGPKPLFMTYVIFHGARLDPTCPLISWECRHPPPDPCAVLMTAANNAGSDFLTFLLKLIFGFYNFKMGRVMEAAVDVYVSQSRKCSPFHSRWATHM